MSAPATKNKNPFVTMINMKLRVERMIILLIFSSVLSFIFWAIRTSIDEVTVAVGNIKQYDNMMTVEYKETITINQFFVGEGSTVKKMDVLATFDVESTLEEKALLEVREKYLMQKLEIMGEEFETKKKLAKAQLIPQNDFIAIKQQKNDLESELNTLIQRISNLQKKAKNNKIIAPMDGKILKIHVPRINAVVLPSQPILDIVPEDELLHAEIQILPQNIGHIFKGQDVTIKITSYDFARYGTVPGVISSIAPATMINEQGHPYYRGIVEIKAQGVSSDPKRYRILPGMTLNADIKTGKKTVMEYLLKPIYGSASSALKER